MILKKLMGNKDIYMFVEQMRNYDEQLFVHSMNVAMLSEYIAYKLGYKEKEIEEIVKGALLHDIGKMYISLDIINAPRKLTEEEMNIIKMHPLIGYEMLEDTEFSDVVKDIVLHHHETENADGYPNQINTMRIETQIVSISDKYEAMRSRRPYKKSMDKTETLVALAKDCSQISYGDKIFETLITI